MDLLEQANDGENGHAEEPPTLSSPMIDDLVLRAKAVLAELEAFRERLRKLRQEDKVEMAGYRGNVQSELSMLERLAQQPESDASNHVARSSNLPFLETIWATAKRSRRVSALVKRAYVESSPQQSSGKGQPRLKKASTNVIKYGAAKRKAVMIDAITDAGRTWTKISLVTNTRLLFDLAKEGWDSGGSDDGDENKISIGSSKESDIPLVNTARDLVEASQAYRVRTVHPSVFLLLPRIKLGETPEVDRIIDQCRACGATVICGDNPEPPPPIDAAIETMAPDPLSDLSDVLNIDCTILLALVSEFSHAKVSKEPWFHTALQRQVEIEDNENLLPFLLYPALRSHSLVTTTEAAQRMREIVNTIGTPSEKARTAIFMGDDTSKSQPELITELQQWSAYAVPSDLHLPILIVDQNENSCQAHLPPEALSISATMTDINKSVFLHGWSTGRTTITSNRTVVKQIEVDLDKFEDLDDSVWPKLWLCPTARSLVGKEKRNGAGREAKGVWPMPDPLRREQQRRNGLDVLSVREGHEVEDFRPNGYQYDEVIAAKLESLR